MQKIYRQYFKVFWGFFLFGTAVAFGVVEAIDPRGENDWPLKLERSYSGSVLNTVRHLKKLSEKPSILVFGTSRSIYLSPSILGSDVINLHVIYESPIAVLDFLERLDERQLANVKEIYYLVDYFAFGPKDFFHPVDYESSWQRLMYKFRNFDAGSIKGAWNKVFYNLFKDKINYVHPNGYIVPVNEKTFDGNLKGAMHPQVVEMKKVDLLGQVDLFAKHHGLKTTYFMPPLPLVSLKQLKFSKKKLFVEAVLRQINGYYEWSYLAQASPFNHMFVDYFHPKFDLMKRLFKEFETPAHFITRDNAHQFLEQIRPYYGNG